ncbi:hypothetical protein JJB07_16540 [Tumebacillus sp. ITR2]|uniref:Uncharacterized protein n=1 Tax=Tumebacillus amylolyticus TaxID=2801339 RepID=A0ABS1JD58_9BACL|nr:hypothetical protein [Tumebacillus amylolyticus]MBL0388223.1 hypothetical protein [Tumebacillus amylolyticus]
MIFKIYPEEWKLRFLITGAVTLVFFGFFFLLCSYYILVSKPFFVFDEQGVQSADGKLSVKYEDVDFFFFSWATMWYIMAAYTKEGKVIKFNTRNVIRAKVAKQYLREIGFVVKE